MSMTGGTTPSAEPTPPATPAPATQEKGSKKKLVIGAILGVFALVAAGVAFVALGSDDAGATEVQLEAFDSTGENPFTASVGDGVEVEPAEIPPTDQDATLITGDTVGLYGGTEDSGRCDPAQLVTFLQQNPDKAAAWASVPGITTDQIPQFVAGLTPLILRSDTAVTNHSYSNGQATSLQSVLQAGTAVLVNDKGEPVVKCSCGNPLLAPELSGTIDYTGTQWPNFNPRTIVVVQRSSTTINNFQVFNLQTNSIQQVPAGSANIPGTPGTPAVPGSPTTTAPPNPVAGTYNVTATNTACEGGWTCPPTESLTVRVTCSGQTCAVNRNPATVNGSTLTYSGSNSYTCNGVDVGASFTGSITVDAAGNLTGTFETTTPAAPPQCPSAQRSVFSYSGTRA